jgi:uncharacterized membrane protein YhaH (DUF805 family)
MNSYLGPLLFGFRGRINRAKYWIAAIAYLSVMIAVSGLGFFFRFSLVFFGVAGILLLALIVSNIFVGIKRLHDRGKSGWWLLVFYLVPILLHGVPLLDVVWELTSLHPIFELASAAVSIWAVVELGFLRGTPGSNQYGPDPLAGR